MIRAFAIGVFLAACVWSYAYPHDHARPDLNAWFDSLKSGNGPCCSNADGTAIADADWASVADAMKPTVHFKVYLDGEWIDVPDNAVITQPNLAGRTMVWPYRSTGWGGGSWQIRCFMPGSMT